MDNLKKSNRKYEYVLALIIIGISIFLICKATLVSKYVFCKLKEELIPISSIDGDMKGEMLFELIPIAELGDIGLEEYETDLSYNNFEVFADEGGISTEAVVASDSDVEYMVETNETTEQAAINPNDNNTDSATEVVSPSGIQPIAYSLDQLRDFDFLVSNCYAVDSSTSVNPDELNADNLLGMNMAIDTSGEDYKVLVYHTHGSETFADSRPGVIEDTVIGVGDELTRLLNEKGIKTYHDRGVYDTVDGVLDRSYAYTLSGNAIDSILAQYPSIEVVLDIHRDGVREDLKLVRVIDGKPTAQIMFLNGVSRLNINGDIDYLYNPNKIANLSFSLQMHLKGKELYGDLMRRIYIRGYSFNLEKKERASLVEVGAQTNTVEEVKNAMIPLSNIIYEVLHGEAPKGE